MPMLTSLSVFALVRQVILTDCVEYARSRGVSNVERPDRARQVSMAPLEPSARIGPVREEGWFFAKRARQPYPYPRTLMHAY